MPQSRSDPIAHPSIRGRGDRAVFLDRDGVLNELVMRDGVAVSPRRAQDFRLRPDAVQAVQRLRTLGLRIFVASNQPDIARGLMDPVDLAAMTRQLQAVLCLDDVMTCPHDDADMCPCRKPLPGMLFALAERWQVELSASFLVGDSWKDVEAGRRAGCRTILLSAEGTGASTADAVVPDLGAAVAAIESSLSSAVRGTGMSFARHFLEQTASIASKIDLDAVERMATLLAGIRSAGGRLFFLGVGGGAGHASHAVNDFRKIAGFEAYTPTDNVSELTARINDEGWDTSYSAWLEGSHLASRDGLFVFSVGGGNLEKRVSVNLVNAVDLARSVGAKVLGVVGRDGGHTARFGDAVVIVPTVDAGFVTPHTEAFQAVIWHLLVSHPALALHGTRWASMEGRRKTSTPNT